MQPSHLASLGPIARRPHGKATHVLGESAVAFMCHLPPVIGTARVSKSGAKVGPPT